MSRKTKLLISLTVLLAITWLYCCSLIGVSPEVKSHFKETKAALETEGYAPRIYPISGRRWALDNFLLTKFGNAAPNSTHRHGQAIDALVLDVNRDGRADLTDVNIVYEILDKKVVRSQGGIGRYTGKNSFFVRQMIHLDCRGQKARWSR